MDEEKKKRLGMREEQREGAGRARWSQNRGLGRERQKKRQTPAEAKRLIDPENQSESE